MSDAWGLLIDGSSITTGDAWERLSALGGGVGQVVSDLDGAIMSDDEITGTVETEDISCVAIENKIKGTVKSQELTGGIINEEVVGNV